jgi:hypothetical protein
MADDKAVTGEPETVYHYTTMDAMMRIAQSAQIWATSIDYLNDMSEGQHFLGLLQDQIPAFMQTYKVDDPEIFSRFFEGSKFEFETRPFVASFSQERDSLSQWRSYCPNGNGVSIGFRADCLKRASAYCDDAPETSTGNLRVTPRVTYKAIEYLDSSCSGSLVSDIGTAMKGAIHMSENEDGEHGTYSPKEYFAGIVERMACFKKHYSFSNEREYRLLVDAVYWDRRFLEFRAARSALIPYVRVKIPRVHSAYDASITEPSAAASPLLGRWDFIDTVIVGPTPNTELSINAVKSFFRKLNLRVEVLPSLIPYRDW